MYNPKWLCLGLTLSVLLLNGCIEKPTGKTDSDTAVTVSMSETKPQLLGDPGEIRTFLSDKGIPNGDIYLQNGKVHINIVDLSGEIENAFAEKYASNTYVLHNVKFTIQQLKASQDLLNEQNLHVKLNLYATSIDVIGNRLEITMPDSSEVEAKPRIEKLIDPNMIRYVIEQLGEPHVTGKIIEIDSKDQQSILILEPGKENPTYWFTFYAKSEIYNETGNEIVFSDLKKGQDVKLWSTGTINDSLPAQATVRRLEVDLNP